MIAIEAKNCLDAWEQMNELFLKRDPRCLFKRNCSFLFDSFIRIEDGLSFPEDLDFGKMFSYTRMKWVNLLNNYISKLAIINLKRELIEKRKSIAINISHQFINTHKNGKNCLLSMVVSRTPDNKYSLTVFARASEVTKRLLLDLCLFSRLGAYLFDHNPFSIIFVTPYFFNEDLILLMYNSHKRLRKIPGVSPIMLEKLKKMKKADYDEVRYKVHKRVMRSLKSKYNNVPPFYSRECLLEL